MVSQMEIMVVEAGNVVEEARSAAEGKEGVPQGRKGFRRSSWRRAGVL